MSGEPKLPPHFCREQEDMKLTHTMLARPLTALCSFTFTLQISPLSIKGRWQTARKTHHGGVTLPYPLLLLLTCRVARGLTEGWMGQGSDGGRKEGKALLLCSYSEQIICATSWGKALMLAGEAAAHPSLQYRKGLGLEPWKHVTVGKSEQRK